jgi:hypothetical protein
MKKFIALSLLAAFAAAAGAEPRRPEPRPPAPVMPTDPTQPYPCIVGIVFIDGVPALELICAAAASTAPR